MRKKTYFIAAFKADGSDYSREYHGCYADYKAAMQFIKAQPEVAKIESASGNRYAEWATLATWNRKEAR